MKTGVIGLGAMGKHMALNLHKQGHLHSIWNRTRTKAGEVTAATDIACADTPELLASECELIITCVSRDEDVLQMITAIAKTIRPGTVVVDTSTVSSETAKQAAEILRKPAANFLDCPVSGGVEGARNATLAMMVGGDAQVLDKVRDTLSAIAKNIVHIGPCGSGQACKAVNQFMAAGINQAVTEALAFGVSMGLDMDKVVDVVASGAAGNWFLSHRGKTMLQGRYEPGFKLALHHKDLEICKAMAEKNNGKNWPLVEMTLIHYKKLMAQGYGDEDISALFRLKTAELA